MGRGRQKAKHTKVARDLKYFSPDTNYGALAKELGGPGSVVDTRLEEDLEKWPEFAGTAASHSPSDHSASGRHSPADQTSDEDDRYVDRYGSDDDDDEADDESQIA